MKIWERELTGTTAMWRALERVSPICYMAAAPKKKAPASEEDDDEGDEEEDDDKISDKANKKHLTEIKKLREKNRKLQEAEDKRREEAEEQQSELDKKAGDFAKLEEKYKKQITELTTEVDKWKKKFESKVMDDGLASEMDTVGVNPKLKKAALKLLREDTDIEMDDDGKVTIDGKSVSSFMKSWAKSEDGKAFIINKNSGGGAQRDGEAAEGPVDKDGKEINPWKKGEHWNMTQQGAIFKADKAKAKRLMTEAGVKLPPELANV